MKFYFRKFTNGKYEEEYHEKKKNLPYIPSSVTPQTGDQYWDTWATYIIEKVENHEGEIILYARQSRICTHPRPHSEYIPLETPKEKEEFIKKYGEKEYNKMIRWLKEPE